MDQWQSVDLAEQPLNGFRGLYESASPINRPLGALSAVSNMIIDPNPALTIRPGLTNLIGQISTSAVNGIHPYYNAVTSSDNRLLVHVGANLYSYSGTTSWSTSLSTGLANVKSMSANINDICCIFDGSTAPKRYSSTGIANLSSTPPAGRYVVSAYEQLFVTGIGARPGDVDFCDDADPETWAAASDNNAGSITITAKEGDYNTWIGFDKAQGQVVIWTRYGLVVLSGPETPNRPDLWSVRFVAPYGTPNGRTVQRMAGTWVWLTDSLQGRGFAFWGGGGVEVAYDNFSDTFETIDWSNIDNASSWVDFQGRYCCEVPITGGTYKRFYYDSKYGWFTGTGPTQRVHGTYRISGKETPLVGDSSGYVRSVEGSDDAGTAISWSAIIGPSMMGDSMHKKQLSRVHVVLSKSTSATATAAIATSESASFGTAATITTSTSTSIVQAEIPAPFASGEGSRSGIFRLQLSGSGDATVHDVILVHRKAGR